MKLDKRLKSIAAMVPPGKILADIGTDHAYLPVHLIKTGQIKQAIAGDISEGPYLAAKKTVWQAGAENCVGVRLGNGLTVLSPGEAEVLVLAGMGANTIIDIITEKPNVAACFERLIIQPMSGAAQTRRYFTQRGWRIVEEDLVLSEGKDKIYQIMAFEKGMAHKFEDILYEIGPLLWERRHPLLKKFLSGEIKHLRKIMANMEKSPSALNTPQYHAYLKKIKELKEKLLCL